MPSPVIGANDTEVEKVERTRSSDGFRPCGEMQASIFLSWCDADTLPKLEERRNPGSSVLAERSALAAERAHAKLTSKKVQHSEKFNVAELMLSGNKVEKV